MAVAPPALGQGRVTVMRMTLLAGLLLVLSAMAPAPAVAQDSYALFHRAFGDWTVLCGQNRASGHTSCTLSAPPPRLDVAGRTNEISVVEAAPGQFRVVVRLRQEAHAALPVFLRIDANDAHQTAVSGGQAAWSGTDAQRIVSQFRAGTAVVLRVHTQDGLPADMTLSLTGFSAAHDTYQRVLRDHGIY